MGQIANCCKTAKDEYELIDELYDINEAAAFSNILQSAIQGKLNSNSFRSIFIESVKVRVVYYVVLDSTQKDNFNITCKYLQSIFPLLQKFARVKDFKLIDETQIVQYDIQTPTKKAVFVFFNKPDIQIQPSNGCDLFVYLNQETPQIPVNMKTLINNKKIHILYYPQQSYISKDTSVKSP